MSTYPHSRPWLVEQHVRIPELEGRWLLVSRCATEDEAAACVARLSESASPQETFRVRDTRAPEDAQLSMLDGVA